MVQTRASKKLDKHNNPNLAISNANTPETQPPQPPNPSYPSTPQSESFLSDWQPTPDPPERHGASNTSTPGDDDDDDDDGRAEPSRGTAGRHSNARNYTAWEDRAIAREVYEIRPWSGEHGPISEAYEKSATNIRATEPAFNRAGKAIKKRFERMLELHRVSSATFGSTTC